MTGRYVALINVPGYMPMDDNPPVFDTPNEAWGYLAKEREQSEDDCPGWPWEPHGPETGEYSDTVSALRYITSGEHQHGNIHEDWPTAADGTGVVYGDTPGSDSEDEHDLGLAYSVFKVEGEL